MSTQETAIQQKLAAMFAANKDEVSIPKIYIDMTGDIEAAAVLDELLFWTLPKRGGKTSLRVFRNGSLWLAVRRSDWWDRKRLTARQSDTAIEKLIKLDLVEKDVFLFDGKPTVHLRMKMEQFVKMYGEKIVESIPSGEDSPLIDLADLYAMMGINNESVISKLQNGEMLNLQNGEIINSPVQPEDTSIGGLSKNDIDQVNRKVDVMIKMEYMPFAKKAQRLLALESIIAVEMGVNPTSKRWHDCLDFIDKRIQDHGDNIDTFIRWMKSTKDYRPEMWSPQRIQENWTLAFQSTKSADTIEKGKGIY
jgi:hypothetical protein